MNSTGRELLEKIVSVTGDRKNAYSWNYAINRLEEWRIEGVLGDFKVRIQNDYKPVKSKTAYFKYLLEREILAQDQSRKDAAGIDYDSPAYEKTYLADNPESLIRELLPSQMPLDLVSQDNRHGIVEFKEKVLWPTLLSHDFFTIGNNHTKSDVVTTKLRTKEGVIIAPLIRGKISYKGFETGIMDTFDAKVLSAVIEIWAAQGRRYFLNEKEGVFKCYCDLILYDVVDVMGMAKAGDNYDKIRRSIDKLSAVSYFVDLSEIKEMENVKKPEVGFKVIDKPQEEVEKVGGSCTVRKMKIYFSDILSKQLIMGRMVTRSKDLYKMDTQVGVLLYLYAVPILISRRRLEKNLKDTLYELKIPPFLKNECKSVRLRYFKAAAKDINGKTVDGKNKIIANLVENKDKSDYKIVLHMTNYEWKQKSIVVEGAPASEKNKELAERQKQIDLIKAAEEGPREIGASTDENRIEQILNKIGLTADKDNGERKIDVGEILEYVEELNKINEINDELKHMIRGGLRYYWILKNKKQ